MHSYSIIRHSIQGNLDWIDYNGHTYSVRCSCGVESGATYRTIEEAHREPQHLFALNSNRRLPVAKFDGQIIDRY